MPSTPSSIGPYRIERELARGGMGIVYLAHDTRLQRRVAIKALPDSVASDPERMARFEREARVLASLNHPNLAAVYDVPEVEGRRYLAMEYIEGESLAERLRRQGALSLDETIEICHQIAAGMEAAHESGVIHRDLKPDNVMITGAERVKVVDFGLAKGRLDDPEPVRGHAVSPVLASSPTMTSPETMPGVILGTAPYLSPEQARGKIVDRRTDIWSFGCVVYECLTGRKLFAEGTAQDTIAAVLERPMSWDALPGETPPRIRELLARCMERDPRKRLRDIGEAGLMLEGARASTAVVSSPKTPPMWRRLGPALGAIGAIVLGLRLFGPAILERLRGPSDPVRRVSIEIPRTLEAAYATLTPDGSTLVLRARPSSSSGADALNYSLYRRRLDGGDFEPIPGTERVTGFGFSPNGSMIFMLAASASGPRMALKRATIDGSSPTVELTTWNPAWQPGAVLESGRIVVVVHTDHWATLNPDGTTDTPIPFGIPGHKGDTLLWGALPGDRGVLLMLGSAGEWSVGVLDLGSKTSKQVLANASRPIYDPHGRRLLFVRQGTLYAVGFDPQRLEVHGAPVPLMDDLNLALNATTETVLSFTLDGTLAYQAGTSGDEERTFVSVSSGGSVSSWSSVKKPFNEYPALSPDGSRIACGANGPHGARELWVLERGHASADLVSYGDSGGTIGSAWAPDGSRLAFGIYGGSRDGVYIKDVLDDDTPTLLVGSRGKALRLMPSSWSPDGETLYLTTGNPSSVSIEAVSVHPAEGSKPETKPLLSDTWWQALPAVSPDGAWLAYQTTQTGRDEIRIRPLLPGPSLGNGAQISTEGAIRPVWSRRGDAVYFESPDNRVMRVAIRTRPTLSVSPPVPVWDLNAYRLQSGGWDIAPDGSLVATQKGEEEGDLKRVDLVLHFDKEMDAKMRSARK